MIIGHALEESNVPVSEWWELKPVCRGRAQCLVVYTSVARNSEATQPQQLSQAMMQPWQRHDVIKDNGSCKAMAVSSEAHSHCGDHGSTGTWSLR